MRDRMRVPTRTLAMVFGLLLIPTMNASAQTPSDHFEKKVRPLLLEKCISCHGEEKQKGGLRLDSRALMLEGGDRGPAMIPGKTKESLLLQTLAHDGELKMPPKNKLSVQEISALTEWVQAGAPWPNSEAAVAVVSKPGPRKFTPEEMKYWAFQPVKQPAVPVIVDAKAPIQNEIDRFLLAKLQEQGLNFSKPADKRTLLRRLTYDLTGLPPTPAESAAFHNDDSPDAYKKVVDRLLASSAYGEKWGRRWLDVARYADSNGMDENLAYVNAWRYRDWVIKSFNADKPYDAFVREQIAGDLIAGGSPAEQADRMTATGFLVIGPKMLAEDDPMKMRMDIIDEQLDTVGQSMMGLTLGCARCHDHKFDPITAADYYSLAGIFYSTKTMKTFNVVATWNERALGSAELNAVLTEHESNLAAARKAVTMAERKAKASAQNVIETEKKRLQEYATAAIEAYQRKPSTKLIVPDPGNKAPEGTIRVQAENYTKGNLLKLTTGYGEGIGVIINSGETPNFAEYEVTATQAGTYQLAVRYAAADPRPVQILLDGKLINGDACNTKTGSWNPDKQAWFAEANVTLPAGKSLVRFERAGPFPHIDQFAFLPTTAKQSSTTPITVEELAKERKLEPIVLQQWLELVESRKGKLPTGKELAQLADANDGPFRISPAIEMQFQNSAKGNLKKLRAAVAALQKTKPVGELAMAVEDGKVENLKIHLRGNHLTLGDESPRRFPQILSKEGKTPIGPERSGRLEFAEWLTRPENPLTARVMVNRIWAGHFGTGLVRSPDNFGKLGERPTHPELLDWLAAEFVQSKWSIKQMHRLIVNSAAYRMSTEINPAVLESDPENKLYSHFNRRRLEAEEVRDGMLAIAGLLDRSMGGTLLKVNPRAYVNSTGSRKYDGYDTPRRSVYLPIIRSGVYDVLQTLDFPDPSVPNGQRSSSTIPTQALLLLNSKLADRTSDALAKSIIDSHKEQKQRIHEAYDRILARSATPAEIEKVLVYLAKSDAAADAKLSPEDRQILAFRGLCRVLMASNEFIFVE